MLEEVKMSQTKVTDITHIPIYKGTDIQTAMQKTASLMKKAPGFKIAYWGVQVEHADSMDLIVGKFLCPLPAMKL
jgi:hypothetical protein